MSLKLNSATQHESVKRIAYLLICVAAMSVLVQCSKDPVKPVWTTFRAGDGLGNDCVQKIAVDSRGTKWITCGLSKISRYDDRSWILHLSLGK